MNISIFVHVGPDNEHSLSERVFTSMSQEVDELRSSLRIPKHGFPNWIITERERTGNQQGLHLNESNPAVSFQLFYRVSYHSLQSVYIVHLLEILYFTKLLT